jgi:hypothetical protein
MCNREVFPEARILPSLCSRAPTTSAMGRDLGPLEFHKIIDRFYNVATKALIDSDALIEKLIGDDVAGIFAPGIAGPDHAQGVA